MSVASQQSDTEELKLLKFILNFLQKNPTDEQQDIVSAIEEHERVLIVSGNGVGKSFAVALAKLAFLLTNPNSKVIGTSGSYSQYRDSVWNPMAEMFEALKERTSVPGEVRDYNNELKINRNWYAKIISPSDPGDLEGRHASRVMVVIEEADKKYIREEHFDSAYSSVTDQGDRFVAIANPPEEKSGPVWDRMQSDSWHTIEFSSFESHNVRKGRKDISGLVTLDLIKEDYENYHQRPFPGVEEAREVADIVRRTYDPEYKLSDEEQERIEGLDTRWFRRRLGVIPPDSSSSYRPIYASQARRAYSQTTPDWSTYTPTSFGYDVAGTGADRNIIISMDEVGGRMRVEDVWSGVDHNHNEVRAREVFEQAPKADMAIDAVGEGSGTADRLKDAFPNAFRFQSKEKAAQEDKYKDRWAEGLDELGTVLDQDTRYFDYRLREELLKAASVVEFEEQYISKRNETVLKATKKDKIKNLLNRSPDFLDASYMCVWAKQFEHEQAPKSLTWGS